MGQEKETAKEELRKLRRKASLRRVMCSRKVAAPNRAMGDVLLSFDIEIDEGATLDEARTLALLIGLEVDLAAHKNAQAGGLISADRYQTASRAIRNNYNILLSQTLGVAPAGDPEE